MQLAGDKTIGEEARVVVTLGHNEYIAFQIFIHHIPGCHRPLHAANSQSFALTQGVIHQALVFTNDDAFWGLDAFRVVRVDI